MRRLTAHPPTQLALNLARETAEPPIVPESTALLQALADLLLEALGGAAAETSGKEGADEPEDHA